MNNMEKDAVMALKDKLERRSGALHETLDDGQIREANEYCEGYKGFLNRAKTERETIEQSIILAQQNGFKHYVPGMALQAGDRVYLNNRGKALILAVIGGAPVEQGVSIVVAHSDSPRLDLKPNPLFENKGFAYLDTHYYGGIKKYQWAAVPLSLHGVVIRSDGALVKICIGEDADDPIFCVTDLPPHLSALQMKREASEVIKGEELDILTGINGLRGAESEAVRLNILKILHEKYGITEEDFVSAELEAVPAYPARDLGLDRGMIGAYGQDDRVCAFPAMTALFETREQKYTALAVLADKEEVGSEGNTGALSSFIKDFIWDLADAFNANVRQVLRNSLCISADVITAFDPVFPEVTEIHNAIRLSRGVAVSKYRGLRGKAETSDASAEFMSVLRRLFDGKNVGWQAGEAGKVDVGGGKTLGRFIANLNIDTVDVGVPLLAMHSPLEVVSKLDVYMAYKAFSAFFERDIAIG
jgi:aspartyl aminopeptidase